MCQQPPLLFHSHICKMFITNWDKNHANCCASIFYRFIIHDRVKRRQTCIKLWRWCFQLDKLIILKGQFSKYIVPSHLSSVNCVEPQNMAYGNDFDKQIIHVIAHLVTIHANCLCLSSQTLLRTGIRWWFLSIWAYQSLPRV